MKKILIISPYIPSEKTGGSGLKLFFTISSLKKAGDITLLCFFENAIQANIIEKASKELKVNIIKIRKKIRFSLFNRDYVKRFYSEEVKKFLINNQEKYDLIYLDSIFSAQYLDIIKIKTILDLHNFHSQLLKYRLNRSSGLIEKNFIKGQLKKVDEFEKEVLENKELKKVITGEIPIELKDIIQNYKQIIPYCSEDIFKDPGECINSSNFLFTGRFDWPPNLEALQCIEKAACVFPEATFTVAGANIPNKKYILNIHTFNNPENTELFFEKIDIFLCPVSYGSGLNIKILQALSKDQYILAHSDILNRMPFLENKIDIYRDEEELYEKLENIIEYGALRPDYRELKKELSLECNRLIEFCDI